MIKFELPDEKISIENNLFLQPFHGSKFNIEQYFLHHVEFGFSQSEFIGVERVEQYSVPLVFFSGNIRSGRGFIVNINLIPGTAS